MISLKSYAPVLARYLFTTPDALYERQRKLVRAGLLASTTGRGPGSGIRVTPPVVSMMVIAEMATGSLADIDVAVQELSSRTNDATRCPLTGASTFGEAFALIIASAGIAASVDEVTVRRSARSATIQFAIRRRFGSSDFGRKHPNHSDANRCHLEIEAKLPGRVIQAIAKDMATVAATGRLPRTEES
jgi:hypothetical protein